MGQEVSTVGGVQPLTDEQRQQARSAANENNELLQPQSEAPQQSEGAISASPLVRDVSGASNASSFELLSIPSPGVMSVDNSRSPSRCSSIMSFEMIQNEQQRQDSVDNHCLTPSSLSMEREESFHSRVSSSSSPLPFSRTPSSSPISCDAAASRVPSPALSPQPLSDSQSPIQTCPSSPASSPVPVAIPDNIQVPSMSRSESALSTLSLSPSNMLVAQATAFLDSCEQEEKYPSPVEVSPEVNEPEVVVEVIEEEEDNEYLGCSCPHCTGAVDDSYEESYFLDDSRFDKYLRSDNMIRNLRGDGFALKQRFHTSLGARITHKSLQTRKATRLENKIELARTRAVLQERRQAIQANHDKLFPQIVTAASTANVLKQHASKQSAKNQADRKQMMKERNLPVHLRITAEEQENGHVVDRKVIEQQRYWKRRRAIEDADRKQLSKLAFNKVKTNVETSHRRNNCNVSVLPVHPSTDWHTVELAFFIAANRAYLSFLLHQFRIQYPLYNLTEVLQYRKYPWDIPSLNEIQTSKKSRRLKYQRLANTSTIIQVSTPYKAVEPPILQGLSHPSRLIINNVSTLPEMCFRVEHIFSPLSPGDRFLGPVASPTFTASYGYKVNSEWMKRMMRLFHCNESKLLSYLCRDHTFVGYEHASLEELHLDEDDLNLPRRQKIDKNQRILARMNREKKLEERNLLAKSYEDYSFDYNPRKNKAQLKRLDRGRQAERFIKAEECERILDEYQWGFDYEYDSDCDITDSDQEDQNEQVPEVHSASTCYCDSVVCSHCWDQHDFTNPYEESPQELNVLRKAEEFQIEQAIPLQSLYWWRKAEASSMHLKIKCKNRMVKTLAASNTRGKKTRKELKQMVIIEKQRRAQMKQEFQQKKAEIAVESSKQNSRKEANKKQQKAQLKGKKSRMNLSNHKNSKRECSASKLQHPANGIVNQNVFKRGPRGAKPKVQTLPTIIDTLKQQVVLANQGRMQREWNHTQLTRPTNCHEYSIKHRQMHAAQFTKPIQTSKRPYFSSADLSSVFFEPIRRVPFPVHMQYVGQLQQVLFDLYQPQIWRALNNSNGVRSSGGNASCRGTRILSIKPIDPLASFSHGHEHTTGDAYRFVVALLRRINDRVSNRNNPLSTQLDLRFSLIQSCRFLNIQSQEIDTKEFSEKHTMSLRQFYVEPAHCRTFIHYAHCLHTEAECRRECQYGFGRSAVKLYHASQMQHLFNQMDQTLAAVGSTPIVTVQTEEQKAESARSPHRPTYTHWYNILYRNEPAPCIRSSLKSLPHRKMLVSALLDGNQTSGQCVYEKVMYRPDKVSQPPMSSTHDIVRDIARILPCFEVEFEFLDESEGSESKIRSILPKQLSQAAMQHEYRQAKNLIEQVKPHTASSTRRSLDRSSTIERQADVLLKENDSHVDEIVESLAADFEWNKHTEHLRFCGCGPLYCCCDDSNLYPSQEDAEFSSASSHTAWGWGIAELQSSHNQSCASTDTEEEEQEVNAITEPQSAVGVASSHTIMQDHLIGSAKYADATDPSEFQSYSFDDYAEDNYYDTDDDAYPDYDLTDTASIRALDYDSSLVYSYNKGFAQTSTSNKRSGAIGFSNHPKRTAKPKSERNVQKLRGRDTRSVKL